MIQRIQSLYLLAAILLNALGFWLPWSTYLLADRAERLTGMSMEVSSVSAAPLSVAIFISIVLLLVSLLMFKRRPQQMKMINIAMLQQVVVLALFSWVHYQVIESLSQGPEQLEIGYGVAVVFPLISLILCWLAKKGVKKDEDLIRSVDRLR